MSARIGVFASGGGTNLQALLDHFHGGPGADAAGVALVVSDREDAGALERAARAGVAGRVIAVKGRGADDVAADTLGALRDAGVELVALAGYLRLVPAAVVAAYRWRMLNIHPALLPAFGGKGMWGHHVHEAVLEAGCPLSGPTVHYVDERYDTGLILAQWPVPVRAGDTPDTLAARVLRVEHLLYPAVVERVAGALRRADGTASAERLDTLFVLPDEAGFSLARTPSGADIRRALGL
ncbi:MAG TPA: phosphoribosylglycinamide formyltransferase [Longimicrobiales bacterium]|nr:phosphoribosylglycinamide formyltransferase [Longimicrobiales bacterium]